jgi:flagella basal body P-ring formation protein FlgA
MTSRSFRTECFSLALATALTLAVPGIAEAAQMAERPHSVAETIHVPTLRDNVSPGSIISEGDIILVDLPANQVGQNIITDPQKLIGMSAAWSLAANRPIRNTDVRRPILAKKGSLVTMTFTTPNMTLSATGRALENGSLGDTIRIVNTSSNKTVEGMVMADGNIIINHRAPAAPQQN